jgi:hypothetical protein
MILRSTEWLVIEPRIAIASTQARRFVSAQASAVTQSSVGDPGLLLRRTPFIKNGVTQKPASTKKQTPALNST